MRFLYDSGGASLAVIVFTLEKDVLANQILKPQDQLLSSVQASLPLPAPHSLLFSGCLHVLTWSDVFTPKMWIRSASPFLCVFL